MKAYSYVLKPMNDRELVASLIKVKRDLDEEIKQREVEMAYQEMIPIVKSDFLIRLLEREESEELLTQMSISYEFDQLKWPIRVAVMELDNLSWRQTGSLFQRGNWQEYFCSVSRRRLQMAACFHTASCPRSG